MKKIVLGFLTFTSISVFASECRIHLQPQEMGYDFPSMTRLATKISKKLKESGAVVVKDMLDANVGLKMRFTLINKPSIQNNGPYGNSVVSDYEYGVNVLEYRNGKTVALHKYSTTDSVNLAKNILTDIQCL